MMEESKQGSQVVSFEQVAVHLAHPKGSLGIKIAQGMNTMNRFISHYTYDLLNIQPQDKVLEVGLGNGQFIADVLAKAQGVSYTGVDISSTMIEEAKRLNVDLLNREVIDLIEAGIEDMPFWEATFDKICTVNTIYFWENPLSALQEVYRVLSENGLFVLAYRPFVEGQTLNFSAYGFREYQSKEVKQLVSRAGFRIVTAKTEIEPPVTFEGQTHHLVSEYLLLQT